MAPPILLLKTKSSPNDGYEDYFSTNNYTPVFVPVLEHRFHTSNLDEVRELFASGAFSDETSSAKDTRENAHARKRYGGMVFTSQRAVEAFTNMIEEKGLPYTPSMPLYTVGPATARTLSSLRDRYLPTSTIHGEETGTGEKLAHMMLDHYNGIQKEKDNDSLLQTVESKPGLLFLVGEQRRDIIPKTLMDPNLPDDRRINIDEMVVYETGEMESFEREFAANVAAYSGDGMWVVVFSPSGCEAMLRVLKLGPFAEGSGSAEETKKKVYIATIGPTTRDHLRNKFGFEPDVCADKPSPEGVGESIKRFMME